MPDDYYIGKGRRKVRKSHSDLLAQKTQSLITLASVLVDYLKGVTFRRKPFVRKQMYFPHCLVEGLEIPSSEFIGLD